MNTLPSKYSFSPHLFWDVDIEKFDIKESQSFLVARVLEYGLLNDWILLKNWLTISEIANQAKKLRALDPVALNFIATLANIPKNEFRCYTIMSSQKEQLFY